MKRVVSKGKNTGRFMCRMRIRRIFNGKRYCNQDKDSILYVMTFNVCVERMNTVSTACTGCSDAPDNTCPSRRP